MANKLEIELTQNPTKEKIKIELDNNAVELEYLPDWNSVNTSSDNYAKLLQEYDLSEIMKMFADRYKKKSKFEIFPQAGNIDVNDKFLETNNFYARLYNSRAKTIPLDSYVTKVVDYLLSGIHDNKDKIFPGWQKSYKNAISKKKKILIGSISIDIPLISNGNSISVKKSGAQHYVAVAFDITKKTLYIFDSASKNTAKDKNETFYILKYAFQNLAGKNISIKVVKFKHLLQPGAGDKKEESIKSYNNQNIFCHTWILWFITMCLNKYKITFDNTIKEIQKLSHKNELLNLAMIKNFAFWLSEFLMDEEKKIPKFPVRLYNKAVAISDLSKINNLALEHALRNNKYICLKFIYCYKNDKIINIDDIIDKKLIKADIYDLD